MYIALYQNVTKEVRKNCGRVAQQVLVELANYVNPLGICWPGLARLGDDTGYSVETVQGGLDALLQQDYIRIHYKYSSVRQRWQFEAYQLSPEVLFIREELYQEALRAYDYCNTSRDFVTKDSQPSSRTNTIQPTTEPTTEEPASSTKDSPDEKNCESESTPQQQPLLVTPPEVQNQKKQKTPTAPTGAKINYAAWAGPLPDESDESAALHVWEVVGGAMPMAVARYLVAQGGESACRAAVTNYRRNAQRIHNPGGYIRALIERSEVDPAQDNRPPALGDSGVADSWLRFTNPEAQD